MKKILCLIIALFIFSLSLYFQKTARAQDVNELLRRAAELGAKSPAEAVKDLNLPETKAISFNFTPYPARLGEPVEVAAQVSFVPGGLGLRYTWFLDGKEKETTLNPNFKFTPQEIKDGVLRCEPYILRLEVLDLETKRKESEEIKIQVALSPDFKIEAAGNAAFGADNTKISEFNSKRTPPGQIPFSQILIPSDPYLPFVNKNGVGLRKGDLVTIYASNLSENYNPACYGNRPFLEFEKNLTFNWTVDGIFQEAKSGRGKDFEKISWILTREPLIEINSALQPQSFLQEGQETVDLEIVDEASGVLLGKKTEGVRAIMPYIELVAEGEDLEKVSTLSTEKGFFRYQGEAKASVKVKAALYNFRPARSGFDYTWLRNGRRVLENKNVGENRAEFSFQLGFDETGKRMELDEETISLEVASEVDQGQRETEKAASTVTFKIKKPGEEASAITEAAAASASKAAPNYFRNIFGIAAVPAVISVFLLFGAGFVLKKRNE